VAPITSEVHRRWRARRTTERPYRREGQPADAVSPGLIRPAALLGPALLAANLASYALVLIAGRVLTPAAYSVLVTLLALLLVGSVPSLALQSVLARRGAVGTNEIDGAFAAGIVTGAIVTGLMFAALPALHSFLHLQHHVLGLVAMAAALLPVHVIASIQGSLQGAERFGRLGVVVVLGGLARLLGGAIPLAFGATVDEAMVGIAVVSAAVAVTASAYAGVRRLVAQRPSVSGFGREVVTAAVAFGGLLVLSSLDVLLARHLLISNAAGRYGAGSVVSKGGLWLPQAVALVALPRLSRAEQGSRALRDALALTSAIGAVVVVVTAAVGATVVRLGFGADLVPSHGWVWPFALQGAALAMVQLLIADDVARRTMVVAPLTLAAAGVELAIVFGLGIDSPRALIGCATIIAIGLAAAALLCRSLSWRLAWSGGRRQ
jgi:O-antigen/teichoic acid export membrane protein